MAAHRGH